MAAIRIACALIAFAAVGRPANAKDTAAARQAYIEGSKHYDLSQYAEALEAFKRAYWNHDDPAILYNIAQCHRLLGHKKDAIDFYRSYLRKAVDPRNREEVQRLIADLDGAIEREKAALATATAQESRPAPPSSLTPTPTISPPSVSAALAAPTQSRADKPVRKRGWVWGVVAGVVAAGVVVGVGVGVGTLPRPPKADGSVAF